MSMLENLLVKNTINLDRRLTQDIYKILFFFCLSSIFFLLSLFFVIKGTLDPVNGFTFTLILVFLFNFIHFTSRLKTFIEQGARKEIGKQLRRRMTYIAGAYLLLPIVNMLSIIFLFSFKG